MKNIIFIAPPAAGKGTQSKLVSEEYNIPHVSTGDLLRNEINSKTELGLRIKEDMEKGNLISDNIIVELLRKRITQNDCNNGYILDGFPRNVNQAKIYDDLLKELNVDSSVVIYMDINKDLALKRTLSRMVCSSCGASYNTIVEALKPKKNGICDKCGQELKVRSDDNEETFSNRFETYLKETNPLIEYYRRLGMLEEIKVLENDSAQDIFNKIKNIIK